MPPLTKEMPVCRVASLTLANAMVFQQILADNDDRVKKLSQVIEGDDIAENFVNNWTFILENINYVPIFTIARNIARELQGSPGTDEALRDLAKAAEGITKRRAALRHDLMGRIYHRLLADAKYLGAYYTTVPAAALLLKLTLNWDEIKVDWSDVEQISKLRIADLACGTGTLLKASLQTIVDNHVRECVEQGKQPDIAGIHRALVEKSLWGLDVVEFAIHLAAAALAIHEPEVQFKEMNLFTLPMGGSPSSRLGSIELFSSSQATVQADLFGGVTGSERVTGKGGITQKVNLPRLDFCVMNPPFVRSVGGNLLFGSLPVAQRNKMQAVLKQMVKKDKIRASITAGLGSVFVALGDRFIRPGGSMSLVLPRALLSGVAWDKTRRLLGEKYHIQYVIVSHQTGAWNFSENTKLSECMIVARRSDQVKIEPTKFINLWQKPTTSIEALTYAQAIQKAEGVMLDGNTGTENLRIGDTKVGEVILCPSKRIIKSLWRFEAAFSQTDLCRTAYYLSKSELYLPTKGRVGEIPTTTLGKLGALGPDARDIHDGFEVETTPTAYQAFWGHDTDEVQALAQSPNKYLSPLPRARKKRTLRDAALLWTRAGRVLIAERLRLTTARVFAVCLDEPVLSNSWWTFRSFGDDDVLPNDVDRIITLWLNSTLGIFSIIASRVDTEGAWIKFKKPILKAVEVLNPLALKSEQRTTLIAAYEEIARDNLRRLPKIYEDEVRGRIDKALMNSLGIDDDLTTLRRMLATEPILKMR